MSHLSVIITDGSKIAQDVQDIAAEWAQAGLVGESVWVSPTDFTTTKGPAHVLSSVIGRGGTQRADLFHTIGVRRLDTVRLVVAQFIATGEDQARELPELARSLAELLISTLPRSVPEEAGQGTVLRRTSVLIPASGVLGVCRDALLPGWDANAIVAAEDRPDLDRASVFVREPGNYSGHAAAAIASIAALWPGIDQGCLDILNTDSTTTDTEVAVVRHTVRAIIRSDDTQELADAACESIIRDPSAPARIVDWARPAVQPGSVVNSVLAEMVKTGDWEARTSAFGPKPEKAERGLGTSIREAALFNAQLFGLAFRAILGMGKRAAENVATGAIVGHEGDYVVRFHPSGTSSMVPRAQALLDAQSDLLKGDLLIAEADSVAAPNAATWVHLRRVCFGLVDGSPLPGEYEVPEIAGKPQLLPPAAVVPDPTDVFVTMDGTEIRSCDAEVAAEYVLALSDAAFGATIPMPSGASGNIVPAAASSDDHLLADEANGNDAREAEAEEDEALQEPERKRAKEGLAALEKWIAKRQNALSWRIYECVLKQIADNSAEAERAYGVATATVQLPVDALRRSQRTLIVAWSILGVLFAAMSVYLAFWYYQPEQMTASDLVKAVASQTIILLLIGVFFNHRFYMAVHHFELMVEQTLTSRKRTAELFLVAQREARRFQLLASRLNDWAEIIGSVLHRPWTTQQTGSAATAVESPPHLPASVAVAFPPQNTSAISPVVMARSIQVLRSQGWANQTFDHAVGAYETNIRSAHDGGHLAADLDTLHSPTSPLGLLRTFFLTGEAASYESAAARESIEKALADGILELPPRSVLRMGAYSDGERVSDVQFFSGVLRQAIPFAGDLWTPNGLMNHKNVPDESIAWMPRAAGPSRTESLLRLRATDDVAMRVDISRRCDISDLEVFTPEARAEIPSPVSPEEGDF